MFDITHVAKLARLGLAEKEKDKLAKDLVKILDFVEKLKEVEISDVAPMAQATGLRNVMRADKAKNQESKERKEILQNAPEKEKGYIKVKAVFN